MTTVTSDFFKKFLNANQIEDALAEVSELADAGEAQGLALVGGVALQIYGSDRLTKDVDFVAGSVFPGLVNESPLSIGGVKGLTSKGTPVDILVGGEYPSLYEETIYKAKYSSDLKVSVATVEHIMAMKLIAGRAKDEEDIKTILRLGTLDIPRTRRIIREHIGKFAVGDFDAFVDEVSWRQENDRNRGR